MCETDRCWFTPPFLFNPTCGHSFYCSWKTNACLHSQSINLIDGCDWDFFMAAVRALYFKSSCCTINTLTIFFSWSPWAASTNTSSFLIHPTLHSRNVYKSGRSMGIIPREKNQCPCSLTAGVNSKDLWRWPGGEPVGLPELVSVIVQRCSGAAAHFYCVCGFTFFSFKPWDHQI